MKIADSLKYTEGYKYRTSNSFWCFTNIFPFEEIKLHRITLTVEGLLFVEAGYSSDGASGPTFNTKSCLPGAIGFHDPIYEILRCPSRPIDGRCDIIQPDYARPGVVNGIYAEEERKIIRSATHEEVRAEADRYLADMLLTHGMLHWRVKYWYDGVRVGGISSARDQRKIFTSP